MFSAIILAAGSSTRMEGLNKQLVKIADIPVFVMSCLAFEKSEKVSEIILATPESDCSRFEKIARNYGVTKLKAVVSGGATRALSVKNALAAVSDKIEYVAIHDGARPLITTQEIDNVLADAVKYNAAIAASPAADTVKIVGSNGFVEDTPPREKLYYAGTPQAFSKKLYVKCLEKLGERIEKATDDSSILEMCGEYVRITEVKCCNMKLTRPDDLAAAEAIYNNRKAVKKV